MMLAQECLEPPIGELLDRKRRVRDLPPYKISSTEDVAVRLARFFAKELPGARVLDVARFPGGASKEQFTFRVEAAGPADGRYVLRMNPLEAIVETDRAREFQVLKAVRGTVPVPDVGWLDQEGVYFGRPSMIVRFCLGVSTPTRKTKSNNVSGAGTLIPRELRGRLGAEFLETLVGIHAFDWRSADMPAVSPPSTGTQAAQWKVGWCRRVWREDRVSSSPVVAAALRWMDENLPVCEQPVLVHGDFRTGNYLFDEITGAITTVLDWELATIGDFHLDLAWAVHRVCGAFEEGGLLCCGLMRREELLARYEVLSGRRVDPVTLHFYEVLLAVQNICVVGATGLAAARAAHSHQDVLLNWSGGVQHVLVGELCRMLTEGPSGIPSSASCFAGFNLKRGAARPSNGPNPDSPDTRGC